MSKLSIYWNRLYERNYICPYNNEYKCSPYKRKMTHQTIDLPIRLKSISHLRKLGEDDIHLCPDCQSCKCKCLWSKTSTNSANDQQSKQRSILYQQSQMHNQNEYNSYLCNYRKQFFRGSPERNDSVTWIMKPIKKMHVSQTNILGVERFLQPGPHFNRSLYSYITKTAGTDCKITKEYFNERRRKLLDIINSRRKSKVQQQQQQLSETDDDSACDVNRRRCIERTNSLRRQHLRLEQWTGGTMGLSRRDEVDKRKCKPNVNSNLTGFTTCTTTEDDRFDTITSSTSHNRGPHRIDSLESLELKTLKTYYNYDNNDSNSNIEHSQGTCSIQHDRRESSGIFRSTYSVPKTDANGEPRITVKNTLRDSTNTTDEVWPHQQMPTDSKYTLQTCCDFSENETAPQTKLSVESCRSSSSGATVNTTISNKGREYLTNIFNERQSYNKSMERLEQIKNEVDYHIGQKTFERNYAQENIRKTESKHENVPIVKKQYLQVSQSITPTTKHITVSRQILPKPTTTSSSTTSKIIIKQQSQQSTIQSNDKQPETIRQKPLPKMISSTTNTERSFSSSTIKNINVNLGSRLPINTFITPVMKPNKLSTINEQPSVYLIGTDERLQAIALSNGKALKSSNANKRKLRKNNSKPTQPNKQSKAGNKKNAKNSNRNLSIKETKDHMESGKSDKENNQNVNNVNSKKIKNRRNRKMSAKQPKEYEAALSTVRNDNNCELKSRKSEEKALKIVKQTPMEKNIDTRLPTIKELPSAMHILNSVKTPIPSLGCSISFHMPVNLRMFAKCIIPNGHWPRKRLIV